MGHIIQYKMFFLKILLQIFIITIVVNGHSQTEDSEPEFLAPLENLTVTQGRDVSFTCVVNDLGQYRVAWIKSDSKAILAIHTHMVALNPRLSVTHNGHNTWKLHISHVQLNDSGSYMCQVNTDPMRSQSGYLDVVVSPDILNQPDVNSATTLEEGVTNEGGTIQLTCTATGVPEPTVQWKRESGKDIILRNEGRDKQVTKHVDGDRLILNQVQRTDMGPYLCIASNGVPPSVSKRFNVQVNFPPNVKAVNQLVGAPMESHVVLQCLVEAFPKPLNGWYKNEGVKLYDGPKYVISEGIINQYTWQMNLTIKNLQKTDFGSYMCSSINALGKLDARIRLQVIMKTITELRLPPKPTTTPTPYIIYTTGTVKPQRKKQHNQSHSTNKVSHHSEQTTLTKFKETINTNHMQQENEVAVVNGPVVEVHTQSPVRPSVEKTRSNTQMPAAVPSRRPPWILHSNTTNIHINLKGSFKYYFIFILLFIRFS